ncbi:MAG: polyamine aminopropyltransferase, partial [Phycisphaerae bacterium]
MTDTADHPRQPVRAALLLLIVFVIAVCGLVYELIAGALASYLLGDSITQFSLVIGIFLTAMGIGSYLSRFIRKHLPVKLILVELGVGMIGGLAALLGFAAFSYDLFDSEMLLGLVVLIGILVGLEIPLVVRILQDQDNLRVTIANVLGIDYLGALAASLLFPLFLLPQLGLVQAGLVMGLTNVLVGGLLTWTLPLSRRSRTRLQGITALCAVALVVCLFYCSQWISIFENRIYQDEVIFSQRTAYQKVVITRWREDIRLYLNGHLQFSSVDEYRYHESLVHPAMLSHHEPRQVLILGGGDGLALREVLTHASVEHVDLVDLDDTVVNLFREREMLTKLNGNALSDPRVAFHHVDAFQFVRTCEQRYDVILADLPDPSTAELAKLYSQSFYGLIGKILREDGYLVTQATSPFRAREAFWCIDETIKSIVDTTDQRRFFTTPYHIHIPTFGSWGFILAGPSPLRMDDIEHRGAATWTTCRFLSQDVLASSLAFPPDMDRTPAGVSSLNMPLVNRYYQTGYH